MNFLWGKQHGTGKPERLGWQTLLHLSFTCSVTELAILLYTQNNSLIWVKRRVFWEMFENHKILVPFVHFSGLWFRLSQSGKIRIFRRTTNHHNTLKACGQIRYQWTFEYEKFPGCPIINLGWYEVAVLCNYPSCTNWDRNLGLTILGRSLAPKRLHEH